MGGYTKHSYSPGLEEMQMDIYLPFANRAEGGMLPKLGVNVFENTLASRIKTSQHTPDTTNSEFQRTKWIDIATADTSIVGQNAVIDKMMGALKSGREIYVSIRRTQEMHDGTIRMLFTDGFYIVSGVDVTESANSSIWAIMSLTLTEFVKPKQEVLDTIESSNEPARLNISYMGNGMVRDRVSLTKSTTDDTKVSVSVPKKLMASPRLIKSVMNYSSYGTSMKKVMNFVPNVFRKFR
jgi:hypothetical protein